MNREIRETRERREQGVRCILGTFRVFRMFRGYRLLSSYCLLTAVPARLANQVVGPTNCTRPDEDPETLQIGDFSPAFSKTRKVAVFITDAPPGGFCDPEDFLADPAYALRALSIASEAYNAGIRVNAIQIPRAESKRTWRWQAAPLMQEVATITGGWYTMPQTDLNPINTVKEAVLRAVYTAAGP